MRRKRDIFSLRVTCCSENAPSPVSGYSSRSTPPLSSATRRLAVTRDPSTDSDRSGFERFLGVPPTAAALRLRHRRLLRRARSDAVTTIKAHSRPWSSDHAALVGCRRRSRRDPGAHPHPPADAALAHSNPDLIRLLMRRWSRTRESPPATASARRYAATLRRHFLVGRYWAERKEPVTEALRPTGTVPSPAH